MSILSRSLQLLVEPYVAVTLFYRNIPDQVPFSSWYVSAIYLSYFELLYLGFFSLFLHSFRSLPEFIACRE